MIGVRLRMITDMMISFWLIVCPPPPPHHHHHHHHGHRQLLHQVRLLILSWLIIYGLHILLSVIAPPIILALGFATSHLM